MLSGLSGYNTLITRQLNDGSITNANITLAAENSSTFPGGWTFDPPRMLSGSQLKVALTPRNARQIELYYQADRVDITMVPGIPCAGPYRMSRLMMFMRAELRDYGDAGGRQ